MVGLCRLCASLRKIDVLVTIKDECNEICEKLRNCCQLSIKMQDVLPKSICQECIGNLNKSHTFYKRVKDAQETLQALYPTTAIEEDWESESVGEPSIVQTLNKVGDKARRAEVPIRKQETDIAARDKEKEINLEILNNQIKMKDFPTNKLKDSEKESKVDEKSATESQQFQESLIQEAYAKESLVNEKSVMVSGKFQENLIQEVYDMLDLNKEEEMFEGTYTLLEENFSGDADKNLNYSEVEQENAIESHDLQKCNVESPLSEEIIEETEVVIIPDNELDIEIEYMEDYEDKEGDEKIAFNMGIVQSENNERQEKHPSLSILCPSLGINSWKEYIYLCFICDFKHSHLIDLKIHIARKHKITDNDKLQYKCYDCQKIIPRYNFFLNHIRSKHHPELKLKCEVCDLNCQNFEELSYHRSVTCADASNYEHILPCQLCFKSFNNSYGLQNHCRTQHSSSNVKVMYKCTICNKEFHYKSSLKVHTQTHTDQNKYSCDFCLNQFKNRQSLEQHIYVHVSGQSFKCNICNKSFKTFHTLDQHHILHTDKKPFKCEYCDKLFRKKVQKIGHERTHTGEMPFPCGQCGKRFRFRSALNAHSNCHTGAKPYSCEYCDKTFADSSNRNKHVKRKHSNHDRKANKNV